MPAGGNLWALWRCTLLVNLVSRPQRPKILFNSQPTMLQSYKSLRIIPNISEAPINHPRPTGTWEFSKVDTYICILAAYRQFAASLFSSVACEKLSCPTVLQIPRTHILFSLASLKIARQSLPTAEGMATLCPASFKLFQTLRQGQAALQASVRDLVLLLKNTDALGTEDVPEDEQEVREDEED
ncbi:hypothetical protein K438DRAFT_1748436 [Mycena galopus ATCC 62051]|nr:hypothetical protein K438DRAFT_1748436 [Mycena galopus ATCC 62051]